MKTPPRRLEKRKYSEISFALTRAVKESKPPIDLYTASEKDTLFHIKSGVNNDRQTVGNEAILDWGDGRPKYNNNP